MSMRTLAAIALVFSLASDAEAQEKPIQRVYPVADLVIPIDRAANNADDAAVAAKLVELITSTIEPKSWEEAGGPGSIEYYPLGMALVVCQTAPVHERIAELLRSLCKQQEVEIAVELRLVRVSPAALNSVPENNHEYLVRPLCVREVDAEGVERIGVDFNRPQVAPKPTFLSDKQVQAFLEAVQSDPHAVVTQAPKLTTFNGQSAAVQCGETRRFLSKIEGRDVNGNFQYCPEESPQFIGQRYHVQNTVAPSGDSVDVKIKAELTHLVGQVGVTHVTTPVYPVFDGGERGEPIQFTGFLQCPDIQKLVVERSAAVPRGKTMLIVAGNVTTDRTIESGTPLLSDIPFLKKYFITCHREQQAVVLLVTPRIVKTNDGAKEAKGCKGDKCATMPKIDDIVPCQATTKPEILPPLAHDIGAPLIYPTLDGKCPPPISGVFDNCVFVPNLAGKEVAEVFVSGNRRRMTEEILARLNTRPGLRYSEVTRQEDVGRLLREGWFLSNGVALTPWERPDGKLTVYVRVTELPNTVQSIVFNGANHLGPDELKKLTNVAIGTPMSPVVNRAARQAILRKYQENGRIWAGVTLTEGGSLDDTRIVFDIIEGPTAKISGIDIEHSGPDSSEISKLITQLNSARAYIGTMIGDEYEPGKLDNDVVKLSDYFQKLGYLDVKVQRELIWSPDHRSVKVIFHVEEGKRFKVGRLQVDGNKSQPEEPIRGQDVKMIGNTLTRDQVKLQVSVMEIAPDAARVIGKHLEKPGGIKLSSSQRDQFTKAMTELKRLNCARSLADPILTALDGQEASFQAGGSFPVPEIGADGCMTRVRFVPYGTLLNLTPSIVGHGQIHLELRASISKRDATSPETCGSSAVPGLTAKSFAATVELGAGESLALAGLGQGTCEWPEHPGERLLVILVTPEIVQPKVAANPILPACCVDMPADADCSERGCLLPKGKLADAPMNLADVAALSSSGVSDEVIINQMHTTGARFKLSVEDILFLKKNNVSDAVVIEMQNSRLQPEAVMPPMPSTPMMPPPAYYAPPVYYAPPPPPVVGGPVGVR
jgi:Flp pilus assembly secretin CpaC